MAVIIIIIRLSELGDEEEEDAPQGRRRRTPRKKRHKEDENYDNSAKHFKGEKVRQHSASPSLAGCLAMRYAYPGKAQQPQEQRYPLLSVCAVFPCVQTMVWLPALGIFTVRTDVDDCDYRRGQQGHRKRVCTEG